MPWDFCVFRLVQMCARVCHEVKRNTGRRHVFFGEKNKVIFCSLFFPRLQIWQSQDASFWPGNPRVEAQPCNHLSAYFCEAPWKNSMKKVDDLDCPTWYIWHLLDWCMVLPLSFAWEQGMIYPGQESREMGFPYPASDTRQACAAGYQFAHPWPQSSTVELGGSFAVVLDGGWIQLLCVEAPERALQVPGVWGMLAVHPRNLSSQLRGPNPTFLTISLCKWCFSGNLFCLRRKKSRNRRCSHYSSWF